MTKLTCYDEGMNGDRKGEMTIDLPTSTTTIEAIIRARVFQEVQDYNQHQHEVFTGLVRPTDAEQVLNGYRVRKGKVIDWEEQAEKAVKGFYSNRFFVMVDGKQSESLEQVVEIGPETCVSFVKLTPLVGG